MENLHQAALQIAPRLCQAKQRKEALEERLSQIRQREDELSLAARPLAEQVAYLRAASLVHMAGIYLGSATTNLAHSPEAFAIVAATFEPGLVEHALATVADEIAYAPMQGVSAEAAIMASLSSIADDVKLAEDHLERASALLAGLKVDGQATADRLKLDCWGLPDRSRT